MPPSMFYLMSSHYPWHQPTFCFFLPLSTDTARLSARPTTPNAPCIYWSTYTLPIYTDLPIWQGYGSELRRVSPSYHQVLYSGMSCCFCGGRSTSPGAYHHRDTSGSSAVFRHRLSIETIGPELVTSEQASPGCRRLHDPDILRRTMPPAPTSVTAQI
ncbi:hypothetical protein B0T20DRAFT_116031 [Sordaria brevicollis]|uniref:Uncharacterized protein n=1 Tax=Sordaria brevicollis TaxID=83679 RepID=A0AAE0PKC5_SORBR|nr:hypothetical protein B0T20DRAFT_116031 [Sordaria brevicollis]